MNFRDIISGKSSGAPFAAARLGLALCEGPYNLAVRARNSLYRLGIFRSWKIPVPVISVGNITAGGTGKTPLVGYLAGEVLKRGIKPVIISRGYGRKRLKANDEAMLLHELLPGVHHVQHPNRVTAACAAVLTLGAEVIILDDAFQHQRIRRDWNILLIDAACPFGYEHMLPRGLLREPVDEVGRADSIIITKVYQTSPEVVVALRKRLEQYTNAPILESTYRVTGLRQLDGQNANEKLEGAKVFLACGVAAPDSVESLLTAHGSTIVGRSLFPDHHLFSSSDFVNINSAAQNSGADFIVFTRKDAVKIPPGTSFVIPSRMMDIEFAFQKGEELFLNRLDETISASRK